MNYKREREREKERMVLLRNDGGGITKNMKVEKECYKRNSKAEEIWQWWQLKQKQKAEQQSQPASHLSLP